LSAERTGDKLQAVRWARLRTASFIALLDAVQRIQFDNKFLLKLSDLGVCQTSLALCIEAQLACLPGEKNRRNAASPCKPNLKIYRVFRFLCG
jgi:hypothetical protein